jgi:predicted transcriptional regulator
MSRTVTRPPRLTVIVNCAVTPQTAAQLRALSAREERPMSSVIRQAIREFIERRVQPEEPAA